MSELSKIQAEVAEWALRNFPKATIQQPLIGVAEECGELCHAHLKAEQGIRGTPEEHLAAKKDAMGDMMIFLMHYCVLAGIDWIEVEAWRTFPNDGSIIGLICSVGELSKTELWKMTRKYKIPAIAGLVQSIQSYARAQQIEFVPVVKGTWLDVRERDWRANKQDGVKV